MMEFKKDNYKLTLEQGEDGIDINLYNLESNTFSLISLSIKPLHQIDTSFDDKTVIRDIPRELFSSGDFYQSSVYKHHQTKLSLLSIIHEMIVENRDKIDFIKNIFSTSLNNYNEETFITFAAINFWDKQLEKAPNLPVTFFEEDQRYKLKIND